MAFSFGFGGDDIADDASMHDGMGVNEVEEAGISGQKTAPEQVEAREVELESLLASLPSTLQHRFHGVPTDPGSPTSTDGVYPRRELQDIRTQIMAEVDPSNVDQVLEAGLSSQGDLTTGVYEGGFKTWECSYDLASQVKKDLSDSRYRDGFDFVELGVGTALVSSVVLDCMLRTNVPVLRENDKSQVLVVADYNDAVLRLVTLPNLLLTWYYASRRRLGISDEAEDGLLEITEELKATFKADLQKLNIDLTFASGSWGPRFVEIVRRKLTGSTMHEAQRRPLVIAASETVYSPKTIEAFTDTVLALLRRGREDVLDKQASMGPATATIAAKQVYFGVGGGVDEFRAVATGKGARVLDIWIGGRGVGRWIGRMVV